VLSLILLSTTLAMGWQAPREQWETIQMADRVQVHRMAGHVVFVLFPMNGRSGSPVYSGLSEWVITVRNRRGDQVIARRTTDTKGWFDCGPLRPGEYRVEVSAFPVRYVGRIRILPRGGESRELLIEPSCLEAGDKRECTLNVWEVAQAPF
jgi:hypothetical protein